MTSLQKKAELLEKKILSLKVQQQHIEHKITQELYRVLKIHNGFSIPFPALVGGILHVLEQAKTNPQLMEAWSISGEKFQYRRPKQQSKTRTKTSVPTTKME